MAAYLAEWTRKETGSALAGARPLSFGHVGDGNIHFTVIQPAGADRAAFMRHGAGITERIHDIALALGGSISAEHGVGAYNREEFERVVAPLERDLFVRIKTALDPDKRMNLAVLPGAKSPISMTSD